MGFLGGLFGTAGGASGTGFSGPSGMGGNTGVLMDALPPVLNSQAQDAQVNSLQQLQQQQALLQALKAQGGLQNQTDVYNQLQNLASGQGPNPAQAQFQQNLNQVAQQQAGAIGAQKGINPGLAARLISQQGGNMKQNAAGQAATLQAQQQIAGIEGMGNMANTMAGQQLSQANALAGERQNQQQMLLGALTGNIGQGVNMQSNLNNANAGMITGEMGNQTKNFGGLLNMGSSVLMPKSPGTPNAFSQGGEVGPASMAGKHLNGMSCGGMISGENYAHQMKPVPGHAKVVGDSQKNDVVDAKLSPGEIIIPRSIATHPNAPEMAARFVAAIKAKQGRGIG